MLHQGLLHFPLPARVRGAQEIEEVGGLENLGGHIGIRRRKRALPDSSVRGCGGDIVSEASRRSPPSHIVWQGGRKVGEGLAFALVGPAIHLEFQDAAAPALGHGLAGIPGEGLGILLPLEEADDVSPGQL